MFRGETGHRMGSSAIWLLLLFPLSALLWPHSLPSRLCLAPRVEEHACLLPDSAFVQMGNHTVIADLGSWSHGFHPPPLGSWDHRQVESCSPLTANLCREGPGGHGMRGGGLLFLENKDRKQSPHPGLISAPPIQNTWTSSYLTLHLTLTSHVVCYSAQACHDKVPETECLQQKTLFFSVMRLKVQD